MKCVTISGIKYDTLKLHGDIKDRIICQEISKLGYEIRSVVDDDGVYDGFMVYIKKSMFRNINLVHFLWGHITFKRECIKFELVNLLKDLWLKYYGKFKPELDFVPSSLK